MKKIVLGLIATMVAILVAATSVKATTFKVDANQAEENGEVNVTLKLDQASDGVQFDLIYDNSIFEYKGVTAGDLDVTGNVIEDGKVRIIAAISINAKTQPSAIPVELTADSNFSIASPVKLQLAM